MLIFSICIRVLDRLKHRVRELVSECNYARVSYRSLHKDRARLEKSKEIEQEKIGVLEAKASNLQLHKFGRIVDLDTLDVDGHGESDDPADVAARKAREENATAMEALEKESEAVKDKLAEATKVNTDLLNRIAALLEEKLKIASDLRAPGYDVLQDTTALLREESEDKMRMIEMVSEQTRQIEVMKAELLSLKRKDAPGASVPSDCVPSIPIASGPSSSARSPAAGFFPPIPNSTRKSL